jgi:ureidoglycolate hydrolase
VLNQGLEISEFSAHGFKPLIFFNEWRVATLCYCEDIFPPAIGYVERHMETDEVFILLHGRATLLNGGKETAVSQLEAEPMETLKAYNFTLGTWHGVIMSPDAVIALMENADTGKNNSEYFKLDEPLRHFVLSEAKKFPEWSALVGETHS